MFSTIVTEHWAPTQLAGTEQAGEGVRVVIDDDLPPGRSAMVLELTDGRAVVTLTSNNAAKLGPTARSTVSAIDVLRGLQRCGVAMNDPDHLYYLPLAQQAEVLRDRVALQQARPLTDDDAMAFRRLEETVPDEDLDEAFVELDHWSVFGSFVDDRLVCAASMIPWSGTHLADLGVITLPEFRGRGLASRTVRALSAHALSQGLEPQYRCQLDNIASVRLAAAAGFVRYGTWHVNQTDDQ